MKLYIVVYGSNDLADENIEQKFGALCKTLKSAQRERALIATEKGEPTGILVFDTAWAEDDCCMIDDTIEE